MTKNNSRTQLPTKVSSSPSILKKNYKIVILNRLPTGCLKFIIFLFWDNVADYLSGKIFGAGKAGLCHKLPFGVLPMQHQHLNLEQELKEVGQRARGDYRSV